MEEANYGREKVQKITNILKNEDVMGNALLMLTLNDMKDMNINIVFVCNTLAWSSCVFVRSNRFCFFGVMLSYRQGFPRR